MGGARGHNRVCEPSLVGNFGRDTLGFRPVYRLAIGVGLSAHIPVVFWSKTNKMKSKQNVSVIFLFKK